MSELFNPFGGLIIVQVKIAGPEGMHDFQFAVDSASAGSSMSGLLLAKLGFVEPPPEQRRVVRTSTGSVRAGQIKIQHFQALSHVRQDFKLLWLEHPPGGMIDGLLGLDFMRGLVLTADFSRGRISLRPPRRWWQLWP